MRLCEIIVIQDASALSLCQEGCEIRLQAIRYDDLGSSEVAFYNWCCCGNSSRLNGVKPSTGRPKDVIEVSANRIHDLDQEGKHRTGQGEIISPEMRLAVRKTNWMKKVPPVIFSGLLVLAGACDHFEDLRLEIKAVDGRTILTALGHIVHERGIACDDENSHEVADVASLPLPAVVICRDWDRNVDVRAEVNSDSAVMHISALSGLTLGTPPAESFAKTVKREIEAIVPGAVVEIQPDAL
jgi:hypothetical protein